MQGHQQAGMHDPMNDMDPMHRASTPTGTARRAQSEFSTFLDDLSELIRGPSGTQPSELRSELERRVGTAREHMSHAMEQAQHAGAMLNDRVQRGMTDARHMVEEKPMQAVTIAAIGGLVLGMLLARKG